MPGIGLDFNFVVDTPSRVFGLQRTPPFLRVDPAGNLAPSILDDNTAVTRPGFQLAGLRIIPEAGVIILEPSPHLVDTAKGDYTFPSGNSDDWIETDESTIGKQCLKMRNSTAGHTFDIQSATQLYKNSCFYLRVERGQITQNTDASASSYYTVIEIGGDATSDSSGALAFRIILQAGYPAFLQAAIPNGAGGWTWPTARVNGVEGQKVKDCSTLFEEQNRILQIEWLPLPSRNTIVCKLANGKETLVFRGENVQPAPGLGLTYEYTNNVSVPQGSFRMWGMNGTAGLAFLPMRFSGLGQILSEIIDLPFTWQGNGGVYLPSVELPDGAGWTGLIQQADSTRTRVQYYVEVTGANVDVDGYSDSSPVIPTVRMDIPPTFYTNATIGRPVDLASYIGEIEERQWFDYQTGFVRTQVGVKFDNTHGDFSAFAGIHRAVKYQRWVTIEGAGGIMYPHSAPIPLLIGWTGMQGTVWKADPRREFDCVVEDNFWVESDVDCGQLTYGDGWCIHAWRRFLLNMAGRSDSFIAASLKTCDFGPNPSGCPHPKLPAGVAVSPRVAPSPTSPFIDALAELNEMDHSVMYCDPFGVADIMPYNPGVYQTPFRGYFNYSEYGGPGSSDFLSSMWRSRKIQVDTKDRRTSVSFYGPDPNAGRLQGTSYQLDDFIPGFTANIQGYRKPLTKVSKWFIDPVFTQQAAAKALVKTSLPTVWEWTGGAFLPGLFALDRYAINDTGADLSGTVYLSNEDIRQRWSLLRPQDYGSISRGRWMSNV